MTRMPKPITSMATVAALCAGGPANGVCVDPLFANEFTQHVSVFGVSIYATPETPNAKVSHAAHLLAQYLDNNEDGLADDPEVISHMQMRNATLVMFATGEQAGNTALFESLPEGIHVQDLYGSETHPGYPNSTDSFDAALEEVLHLVTATGWSQAYPAAFGEYPGTSLSNAMDTARGGHYEEFSEDECDGGGQCALPPGGSYSSNAWYTYDDDTCSYSCMNTEYFYWSLTSILGGQEGSQRLDEIEGEWSLNTASKVAADDPSIYTLLTSGTYALPTRLPDGSYSGAAVANPGSNPCSTPAPEPSSGLLQAAALLTLLGRLRRRPVVFL